MNEELNNQNSTGDNSEMNQDTTYHRSYINDSDPNAKTYVNEQNQERPQNQNGQQTPPVYATYTPGGTAGQSGANTRSQTNFSNYQSSTAYSNAGNMGSGYQTTNPYGATQSYANDVRKKPGVKTKKEHKVAKFIGKAVAFGAIAGCVMIGMTAIYQKVAVRPTNKTITNSASSSTTGTVKTTAGSGSTGSVSELVDNVMPSIVSITSTFSASNNSNFNDFYYWFYGGNDRGSKEQTGSGSGVVISENDDQLMIVTNNHVISDSAYGDATKVQVTFSDDKVVEAAVKGKDADADLAVLTVDKSAMDKETLDMVKVAVLGDSESLRVGDEVVAIGNALGYGQSVTRGIVSAKNREIQLEDGTMTLLQTDAAINPGNSGGALLNTKGELIAINSVKYASEEVEGMGYAIPMEIARPIIEELMNEEKVGENEQAYLGIYGTDVSSDLTDSYDMPEGVWVTNITDNSPAEKAGIQQRDIITKFNDHKITTMDGLQAQIARKKAGTEVTLTIQRQDGNGEYKEMELSVKLGNKKDASKSTENSPSSKSNQNDNKKNEDDNQQQNPYGDDGQMIDPFEYFFGN